MKHIEANNQSNESSCSKLAASVIHQGVMDFVRTKKVDEYNFLTGRTEAVVWFEHAQVDPLKGALDELHEKILMNLAEAKAHNAVTSRSKRPYSGYEEELARARHIYYKKDPELLKLLRRRLKALKKEIAAESPDPMAKVDLSALELAPKTLNKIKKAHAMKKEIDQLSRQLKDKKARRQCA